MKPENKKQNKARRNLGIVAGTAGVLGAAGLATLHNQHQHAHLLEKSGHERQTLIRLPTLTYEIQTPDGGIDSYRIPEAIVELLKENPSPTASDFAAAMGTPLNNEKADGEQILFYYSRRATPADPGQPPTDVMIHVTPKTLAEALENLKPILANEPTRASGPGR